MVDNARFAEAVREVHLELWLFSVVQIIDDLFSTFAVRDGGRTQTLQNLRDISSLPAYGVAFKLAVRDAEIHPDFNESVQVGQAPAAIQCLTVLKHSTLSTELRPQILQVQNYYNRCSLVDQHSYYVLARSKICRDC